MEKDISFNYENIYVNMDENEENHTKKLLNDHVATDSFFAVIYLIVYSVVVFYYVHKYIWQH